MANTRPGLLDKYFYFFMSLLIAVTVVFGFSRTVDQNLIHATPVRPWILYLHAGVFFGWVVFFVLQSSLVRVKKVAWHRMMGWFGVALGVVIPLLGVSTSIAMGRFNFHVLHRPEAPAFLLIPLFDMVCFTTTFALAVYWRKKPEFHRRLMLVASCALTAAAFGRVLPLQVFYLGVDFMIALGVVRDLIVNRNVHTVYRYALPLFFVGQCLVIYIFSTNAGFWLKIANGLLN